LFVLKASLGEMKYCSTKQLHKLYGDAKSPSMDCKIQKDKYGDFYLLIPYVCKRKKIPSCEPTNPVSMDPGIRKFGTTYAPNSNESYILGNRWATKITSDLLAIDKIYSELSKKPKREKRLELTLLVYKLRKKVENRKRELHFKCANFLSKHYDLVMLPKLETGKLCIRVKRQLTTKTVRNLLNAGHCKFFDILKDKCWENGSKFLHCREEYTSLTCPCCGALNKCNETYNCSKCKFVQDRDIVGACNILLKGVREESPCS
jgi:putative transposase